MSTENDGKYRQLMTIPAGAIDENGHVNNVQYLQWMQDIAVSHYSDMGGSAPTQSLGATWVVRSHMIEYFRPAFEGDEIEVRTWVVNLRRVRSRRRYEFSRKDDGSLLVKGETDWVFVDVASGRPLAIPENIAGLFTLVPDEG